MTRDDVDSILTPKIRKKIFEELGIEINGHRPNHEGWITNLYLPSYIKEDRNPDFSVNVKTGAVNDFGSGFQGDIYTLVMEAKDFKFPRALEWVCTQAFKEFQREYNERDMAEVPLEIETVEEWSDYLVNSDEDLAQNARAYLGGRGLSMKTVKDFRIGLRERKDRFWIFFPYKVEKGTCKNWYQIAFRDDGWVLDGGQKVAKSSGKSCLYPLQKLKSSASVLLCEGEIDVLTAIQHGYNAVTSTAGAQGFKDSMANQIADHDPKAVFIAFDGDETGRKATMKVAKKLARRDISVRNVELPDGHDVNSIVVEQGPDALLECVRNAETMEIEVEEEEETPDFNPKGMLLHLDSQWNRLSKKQKNDAVVIMHRILARTGRSIVPTELLD